MKCNKVKYPAAELLAQHCYEDYQNELERYNRMYDKINIALTFCGVILMVFLAGVDFSVFDKLKFNQPVYVSWLLVVSFLYSLVSLAMIVIATIILLFLLEGKSLRVFDSIDYRNKKRFTYPPDQAALSLIIAYTNSVYVLSQKTKEKQEKYDFAIIIMAISVLVYTLSELLGRIGDIL